MPTAKGPFDVTVTPQESAPDAPVSRMLLYKEFHGDLEAIAHGEMIAGFEPLTNAGVYVAIDRVTGTLHGRAGSFLSRIAACGTPKGSSSRSSSFLALA